MTDGLVRFPADYAVMPDRDGDVVACTVCGAAAPVLEGRHRVVHRDFCPTVEGEMDPLAAEMFRNAQAGEHGPN